MTIVLGGCTTAGLPKSGPDSRAIAGQALLYQKAEAGPAVDYAVFDIDETVLAFFQVAETAGLDASFGAGGGPPSLRLGIGDTVQVSIFESSAGGLFIPAEAGSRPGNFISLPQQVVDSSGAITVPYAGRIRVAGRSPGEVEAAIRGALADRAIEPQAVLTLVQSRANEVSVLGDVNAPDKFGINPGGERILDAISRAGGIRTAARESYVTVQRGGRGSTVLFETLLADPRENIFVYPGDIVFVKSEARTFTAFGAAGRNGRFDFENANLTLADAVGKAGGLLDGRADPASVFLYRLVSAESALKLGMPVDIKDARRFPVIFRLNLRDPSGFFLAQKFAMQDRDVLYVDNAVVVDYLKVLDTIGATSSAIVGSAADIRAVGG